MIFSNLFDFNYCTVLHRTINKNDEENNNLENLKTEISAVLTEPSSRAYNCFLTVNFDCDIFESNKNVGTIIGSPNFLENGPRDGEIASAGNLLYDVLNEHRVGRWNPSYLKIKKYNATHSVTNIVWTFNEKTVLIDKVEVYLSNGDYTEDQSIRRSSLNLACSNRGSTEIVDNYTLRFDCYIRDKFVENLLYSAKASGILLSTLKIIGQDHAFYQIADLSLHEPPVEQINTYHGFVSEPLSRAKLCQLRINKNCGLIVNEPQSVEGFQGFPYEEDSPPDGKIASANNSRFKELDQYGADRWNRVQFPEVECHNQTHVSFNLNWFFTASHRTSDIQIFISNENYTSTEPLSRKHLDLDPLCTAEFHGEYTPRQFTILCPISLKKYQELSRMNELLLLSIWNVYDTSMAFYQVIDIERLSEEQSYESILRKCQ